MRPLLAQLPRWGTLPGKGRSLYWRAASLFPGSCHFRHWGDQDLDFDEQEIPALLGPLRRGRTVFFHGWKFRGFQSVAGFRDRLVDRYRPTEAVRNAADFTLTQGRERGDRVVGVHVRWEDYRGTPYFLEAREYLRQMERLVRLLAPQKVSFLVFSNETIPRDSFPGLEVLFVTGNPFEDLYTMAGCDLLLAPPSTFSGWASFYGRVPLFNLSRDRDAELDGFSIVRG